MPIKVGFVNFIAILSKPGQVLGSPMQSRHIINNCTVDKRCLDNECSAWIRKGLGWTESRYRSQGERKVAERDVPRDRRREEVSKGLSDWALVESVLGSDTLAPYIKLSVPFPGQ